MSSGGSESQASAPGILPPAPPANTPATQSLVGDLGALNLNAANDALGGIANGTSEADPKENDPPGKGNLRAHVRSRVRSDVPLLRELFKSPAKRRRGKVTNRALDTPRPAPNNPTPPNEHVHEHSIWMTAASEDIEHGLARLATAAEDSHRIDDSKTVEEYYSEKLAELIQSGRIRFDPSYLQ